MHEQSALALDGQPMGMHLEAGKDTLRYRATSESSMLDRSVKVVLRSPIVEVYFPPIDIASQ
jgi:hypothetical protein